MISTLLLAAVVFICIIVFKKIDKPNQKDFLDLKSPNTKNNRSLEKGSFLTEAYCQHCNTLLEDNSNTCSKCGEQH